MVTKIKPETQFLRILITIGIYQFTFLTVFYRFLLLGRTLHTEYRVYRLNSTSKYVSGSQSEPLNDMVLPLNIVPSR